MTIDKTYDYIIYSASLSGVLTALDLSNKGNSVLLLNFYGFMGGSTTESLNCYQTINENHLNKAAKDIFDKIRNAKNGILCQDKNNFIINPEVIKIILQEELENSNVDLLFHIVPFYLKQKEGFVELSLTGKEGIFHVRGRRIIDASEEYNLLKLENAKRSLSRLYYSMFLTGLNNDDWQGFKSINKFIKLNDNRYWVSLKMPKPENEFFIENNSQKIVNEFETVIQKSGGRIQLLAPQTQKIYDIDKLKVSDSVFHIKNNVKNNYSFSEVFGECSEL
jgi:hypothetical protein